MKMAAPKSTPKDAQVMAAILKDMGVTEYEPRVINLMLEFTYRYVTNILDDARIYSTHAKKKNLDTDDIRLAVQFRMDNSFTSPPPRDLLIEIARQKNNTPLPLIKPHCGTRLPPDRYCLSASNYKLKSIKKPKMALNVPMATQRLGLGGAVTGGVTPVAHPSSLATNMAKINPVVNVPNKLNTTLSLVTRGVTAPTVTIVTRPASTVVTKTVPSNPIVTMATPTPVIQISQGSAITAALTAHQSVSQSAPNLTSVLTCTGPYSGNINESSTGIKRKREDDNNEGLVLKKEPI